MKNYIVSPSFGRVIESNDEMIQIFIPLKENHKLFAPIGWIVKNIKYKHGKVKKQTFSANILKRGSATFIIENKILISFTAFVGLPYRVNRIKFYKKRGDKLRKGQMVGEILFGSMTEIIIPPKY